MPDGAAAVAAPSRRDRIVLITCIALISALAWAYLIYLAREMSSEMAFHAAMGMSMTDIPWTLTDGVLTFVMWTVMMIGMMAGSAAPVLLLFAASRSKRGGPGARTAVFFFGLGYFIVWAGFSALAAAAQWALHANAMLSDAMSTTSPYLAGGILIAAGAYQLTPWKGACLTHCRSPLGFLMSHWRDGQAGAFQMGLRHGAYCLGCCWALMIVLFAVGVMNLLWVAALTVFVLIEKAGPAGTLVARVAGAGMVIGGIARILSGA